MRKILPVVIIIAAASVIFGLSLVQDTEAASWRTSEISTAHLISNLQNELVSTGAQSFHFEKKYDYFGSLTLTGYAVIIPSQCGKGPSLPCDETNTLPYVYFFITSSDNEGIFSFLRGREGKAFVAKRGIGLGCYDEEAELLFSKNSSDYGSYDNLITGKSLEQLGASGPKNQIRLKVTRPIYTSRKIAPYCYSLFRDFAVLPGSETLAPVTQTTSSTGSTP